jgi:hypothetical protein
MQYEFLITRILSIPPGDVNKKLPTQKLQTFENRVPSGRTLSRKWQVGMTFSSSYACLRVNTSSAEAPLIE